MNNLSRRLLVTFALFAASILHAERKAPFSLSVGTQTIDAKYSFTDEPMLIETAKVIREMGSDTLKISLTSRYSERYGIAENPAIQSVRDLIEKEPSYRQAFAMPFRNIMFWLYPFADQFSAFKEGSIPKAEADAIYKEIYEFTAYLLKEYSGSGKSFFIGNWEGDWHLTGVYDFEVDATEEAIKGATEWFRLREKAVADARRDTPHEDVEVYFYIELCFVQKALKEDRPAIVNRILPYIKTDFVSWSSYDTSRRAGEIGGAGGRQMIHDALDYIEQHLPPSDIPGKRVFIGEYGYKHEWVRDPQIQAKYTADLIRWSLEWGCPFILYWQLYCNEIRDDNGKHRGFWLIDKEGTRLPVWDLHKDFLSKGQAWVDAHLKEQGTLPTQAAFNAVAKDWIPAMDDIDPAPPVFEPKSPRKLPFSVSVGTQVIDSKYQFTDEPFLIEAAKEVLDMGGDTLKFDLSRWYPSSLRMEQRDDIRSCLDLVQKVPEILQAMDMPFRNIMMWVKAFPDSYRVFDTGEFPEGEEALIYQEIYDLTCFLLKRFSGSGKSLFIGNWEGDWHLTKVYDFDIDTNEAAIEGAIKWFTIREKAVADARRDTPHHDVEVFFYIEFNFLAKALLEDRPAIVNRVLPHVKTDYVSWSSYDTTRRAGELGGEAGRKMVHDALDYIESKLPPSDIPGKRVFIGEYGYKHEWVRDPMIQAKYTSDLIRWALEWGCPFILYWQLYCNELREDTGTYRGFWLINTNGTRLPVWRLHNEYLEKANAYVDDYVQRHGRLPVQSEFNDLARHWVRNLDHVPPAPPLFGPRPE